MLWYKKHNNKKRYMSSCLTVLLKASDVWLSYIEKKYNFTLFSVFIYLPGRDVSIKLSSHYNIIAYVQFTCKMTVLLIIAYDNIQKSGVWISSTWWKIHTNNREIKFQILLSQNNCHYIYTGLLDMFKYWNIQFLINVIIIKTKLFRIFWFSCTKNF